MSYFHTNGEELPLITDTTNDSPEEVADGVTIERRQILWLSAAGVTALLAGQSPRTQSPARKAERPTQKVYGFAEFLEDLYPLARRLIDSNGSDEEAYLLTVAAAMTRIADPKTPLRAAMKAFRDRHHNKNERFPIAAMSMKLKPGKGFSHHDHLDYNGVIMGIGGEARVRNYDFVGSPPALDSGKSFQLRETRDDLILPGRISTLGRNRDNVHDLIAGNSGAHVLDVFTFFSKKAGSRSINMANKPRDADRRIYEASWHRRG